MSLIVEDGTLVTGAESYVSVTDADAYWLAHNNDTWAGSDTPSKEAALREATQYLETTYTWIGERVRVAQPLCWPRWIMDGMDKDNRLITSKDIPVLLKQAQCELALERLVSGRYDPTLERQTKQEVVGPLSVTYVDGATGIRRFPLIDKMVWAISSGGGAFSLTGVSMRG